MSQDKVFIGKTSSITTKFGEIVKISLGPQDMQKLSENLNDAGWINLEMKTKRDGGHYLEVSNWKPTSEKTPSGAAVNQSDESDDLPF